MPGSGYRKVAALTLSIVLPLQAALVQAAPEDIAAARNTDSRLLALDGTIQSMNEELSAQRAQLGSLRAEMNGMSADDAAFRRSMLNELKALRRQNQSLLDSLFARNNQNAGDDMNAVKPLQNYDMQTPDGKMFFGEDEYIYVKEANATIDSRIDTGAAVSSISASDVTEFERNGKKWYRFNIVANDRTIQVEAPFVRYSDIRQSSKETITKRPVVRLNVRIGDFATDSEFTLTDRSRMQYALLIGRSLIQDIAVVDVARDHIQKRADPDGLIILQRKAYLELKEKGINPNADWDLKQQNQAGQKAFPAGDYGTILGSDPDKALPQVIEKTQAQEQTQTKQTQQNK